MTPTETAAELRRYSRKIGQPAGDVPSVMLAAAEEIERLMAKLEAAEKERDALRAKIKEMERQEPVAYMPLVTVARLESGRSGVVWCPHDRSVSDVPVYALPGAKGE